jgi:hypothetical protein
MKLTENELRRFRSKINTDGPIPDQNNHFYKGLGPCHEWTAALRTTGYGQFHLRGRSWSAHRLVWVMTKGDIPEGLHILHACDNPLCVNPDHLFLGTHFENMMDRTVKKRTASGINHGSITKPDAIVRGSRRRNSKLKEHEIEEIRSIYSKGGSTYKELAKKFGVHPPHIGRILKGRAWSHVAVRAYDDDGWVSTTKLSKLLGISDVSLKKYALKKGVAFRVRGETLGSIKWNLKDAILNLWADLSPDVREKLKSEIMSLFPDRTAWEVHGNF